MLVSVCCIKKNDSWGNFLFLLESGREVLTKSLKKLNTLRTKDIVSSCKTLCKIMRQRITEEISVYFRKSNKIQAYNIFI